jgi:hypothetical protein
MQHDGVREGVVTHPTPGLPWSISPTRDRITCSSLRDEVEMRNAIRLRHRHGQVIEPARP